MMKYFFRLAIGLLAISVWLMPQSVWAATAPSELAKAVESIENLDLMRSGLTATLEGMYAVFIPDLQQALQSNPIDQ